MIREIVTYDITKTDNPAVLREKTRKVTDFKAKETIDCIQDLNDTLDDLILKEGNKRGAIGLSATQIGVDLAISAVTLGDKRYMLINPVLIEENGKQRLFRIGCFSLFKYRAMVRYNDDIVIAYYDPKGNRQTLSLKGDRSCVVQHEMDHLIGDLLFERLGNKEEDLFIARESLYREGIVPIEYYRKQFGEDAIIPTPVWYSALFNDYTDYCTYVEKQGEENADFLDIIEKYTPAKGKILEAGGGTSALSVCLSGRGYETSSCQSDPDMMELGRNISRQNEADVSFKQGKICFLPYEDNRFDTIFSHEVLETLRDAEFASALEEGLRLAKTYVFMVPTRDADPNRLKGSEQLKGVDEWKSLIEKEGRQIKESVPARDGYQIFAIQ